MKVSRWRSNWRKSEVSFFWRWRNQIGWKFGKLSSDKEWIGLSSRLNWSHCIFGPGLITSAHHNVYHHTLTKTLSTHIEVYWLTNLKTISDDCHFHRVAKFLSGSWRKKTLTLSVQWLKGGRLPSFFKLWALSVGGAGGGRQVHRCQVQGFVEKWPRRWQIIQQPIGQHWGRECCKKI